MPGKKQGKGSGSRHTEAVPDVRAILVSDIHLQATAPVSRAGEPDWFAAMARPLAELSELHVEYSAPVLYAGDIFDRWNASPEVINFALSNLPSGWAVPGQHDLPNHSYDDIKRSAYWTLVKAGLLEYVHPGMATMVNDGLFVWGFPWGFPVEPIPTNQRFPDGALMVALVHRMIWIAGADYPGAPVTSSLSAYKGALCGYDAAVFGDNHKGFCAKVDRCTVWNCGALMRRKSDERDYRPRVGLLMGDGTVAPHYLSCDADVFSEVSEAEIAVAKMLDVSAFVDGLRGLGADDALDFEAALRRFIETNAVSDTVASILLTAASKGGHK